jgi:hypothetical protein
MPMYSDQLRAPIVLIVMMHIYATAEPLENSGFKFSAARTEALRYLLLKDLIRHEPGSPSFYRPTPAGCAWVERLLEVTP